MGNIFISGDYMGNNVENSRNIAEHGDIPAFLEQLSKDIRSQVNNIFGFAELISHEEVNKKVSDALIDIRKAASKALHVSEAISDLVKINNNTLKIEEEEYCFEDLSIEIRTMLEQSALRKGLEAIIEFDPDIPYTLIGDHERVLVMLMSMIAGAVDATDEGLISFNARCLPIDDKNVYLKFDLTDTSPGILNEGMLEALAGKPVSKISRDGEVDFSAIGSFVTRYMATRMGGKFTARVTPGKGVNLTLVIRQGKKGKDTLGRRFEQESKELAKSLAAENLIPEEIELDNDILVSLQDFGLNVGEALANFDGDEEEYIKVLLTTCRSSDTKAKMLNYYLEQHDYKNYVTAIHGILGVAQAIGADSLATKARELESAAKQGRRELIEMETRDFSENFDMLLTYIRSVIMSQDKIVSKGLVDKEDLRMIILELRGFLADYNIVEVETLFYSLGQFSFSNDSVMELIHRAEEQMLTYNYNAVEEILEQILAELDNE